MHSYTLRTSEHWLQSVFIFLPFLSGGKIIRLVLFCMSTTENLECARNAGHAVDTIVGSRVARAMLHPSKGPNWGTAFCCDLLWASECFHPRVLPVLYSCAQTPNKLICWHLRHLSSYFFYQMLDFTFKYCDGNVICQIFCVGSENTLKLRTFLLLYWKQLL